MNRLFNTIIYFVLFFSLISSSAFAATYKVTSTADGAIGDGVSLRWAITQANANAGADIIDFNLGGAGEI